MWQAANDVDTMAGEARLRYITDVPGQQAVYLIKLDQARAYLADTSSVPSYIAAEAVARGIAPEDLAQMILGVAAVWSGDKGPAIEAARIKTKLAIEAAKDPSAVQIALDVGLAVLKSI